MERYIFNPETAFNEIEKQWLKWHKATNAKGYVIGISGGKDSSVVAALATKIFGAEYVYGVSMPSMPNVDEIRYPEKLQKEIGEARRICELLGIRFGAINICSMLNGLFDQFQLRDDIGELIEIPDDSYINTPPRIRMSVLYSIAQTLGYRVLNTCNLSENMMGYSTLFGDTAGSFSPISELTATEVVQLGKWLGLPSELVEKTPSDGLCGLTDEEKLGFSYEKLDAFIRYNEGDDKFKRNIWKRYDANKFKLEMIQLPKVKLKYPNFITTPLCAYSPLQDLRDYIGEPEYTRILENMLDMYHVNGLRELSEEAIYDYLYMYLEDKENEK